MPVGLSDGTSYDDSSEWLANSGDKPYTGGNLGPLQRGPKIDDRRDESFVDKASAYLSQNLSTEKLDFIMSHPNPFDEMSFNAWKEEKNTIAQPPVPDSELGKQLGSDDITMPLGGSTEPAGALKPGGSTNVPEKAPRVKIGDKLPNGETVKFTTSTPLINFTDEDIDRAMNIALSAGPGTIAGVKSISNLSGAAKNEALSNLGHAQVLEAAGEHPDAVTKETGFFRGTDSRWRYEIDDSKSVFNRQWPETVGKGNNWNESKEAWLKDILDHPELYKTYPDLKTVKVIHDPTYSAGSAEFNGSNTITMGPKASSNQGILMHEIQHVIQDTEGFAAGGAPGMPGVDFQLKFAPVVRNEIIPEFAKLIEKQKTEGLSVPEEARLHALGYIAKRYEAYHQAGIEQAHTNYLRLAGEAESRNVDTRLLMTERERRLLSPRHTEDINPRDQIVVKKPALATAYGVRDPVTGQIMKSEPVPLRSEAQLRALQVEREAYERTLKMSKADRIAAREERYRQLNPPVVQDNKLK